MIGDWPLWPLHAGIRRRAGGIFRARRSYDPFRHRRRDANKVPAVAQFLEVVMQRDNKKPVIIWIDIDNRSGFAGRNSAIWRPMWADKLDVIFDGETAILCYMCVGHFKLAP
jgi:hypothetical protein